MSNERPIDAAMKTALQAGTVRPVLIARLDILTDPVIAWTGPGVFSPSATGDAALDGQIFTSFLPALDITSILEDQGIGGPVSFVLTGHDLNETGLQQIVKDKRQWRGRKAWLWHGLLLSDEETVIANPIRVRTSLMVSMIIRRSDESYSLTVILDKDLGRAQGSPFRLIDHARLFPSDTWSTFILKLANKPGGFGVLPFSDPNDRDRRIHRDAFYQDPQ